MEENINMIEIEENEVNMINDEPIEEGGKSVLVPVLCGVALVAGAVAVYLRKTKDKREQKQVEKLRKKGYTISAPWELKDDGECYEAEIVEEE